MTTPGPRFYAWCNEASRIDALEATLSALARPDWPMEVHMAECDVKRKTDSRDEALATVRAHFTCGGEASVDFGATLPASQRFAFPNERGPDYLEYVPGIHVGLRCFTEAYHRRRHYSLMGFHEPRGPLEMYPQRGKDFFRLGLDLAWDRGPRSLEAEVAVLWRVMQVDLEAFLLCLCAPDASGRVRTGGCTNAWDWNAPVATCATYNADAREIARDLAVSWVHLHDKDSVTRIAGIPLPLLHTRVDAAPRGARVSIAERGPRITIAQRETHVALKRGKPWTRSLSRETVLKALAASPSALLDALEASAAPDEAWRAAAPRADEILDRTRKLTEAGGEGPPVWSVDLSTYRHRLFLKRHPPFLVRRLPNGGVMLATHPYCSLWPLWADALTALGLMDN
ncbi:MULTISPECIES: hypothetical protein [Sorangium]|uniref:Uncharacterized protein n=1 Tax=Sorangium cellulosum TaxID=56 RepID=A0A4P2R2N3_SORCE|nr:MULTISPECIES: hypothetical protein [Sorangium]AUX36831.1 hypothetical protein SOCE836_090490 [Sorangium cellulosum]WCQ96127.1 hypothetical protein NQZ70_08911 [Sorangium sp. Soce836]